MASNNAFKVTKDTSARKNTRVGSIQSAVEAAAMRESHEYYVNRLTEGYKQQLETMEQSYEDQIRELKSQHAVTIEKAKKEATEAAGANAAEKIAMITAQLKEKTDQFNNLRDDFARGLNRESKAEKEYANLRSHHLAEIAKEQKKHKAELDRVQREKTSGPYQWVEIKLRKRVKSRIFAPKVVVKRGGTKFSDMVRLALNANATRMWSFEHDGRPLIDTEKTLTQLGLKDGDDVIYFDKPTPSA